MLIKAKGAIIATNATKILNVNTILPHQSESQRNLPTTPQIENLQMCLIHPKEILQSCTVIGGKSPPRTEEGDQTLRRLVWGRYTEWLLQWANNYKHGAWVPSITPLYGCVNTTKRDVQVLPMRYHPWQLVFIQMASKYPSLFFSRTPGQDAQAKDKRIGFYTYKTVPTLTLCQPIRKNDYNPLLNRTEDTVRYDKKKRIKL